MKILITGGAGYIGSHTALALLESGHQVTIIDNLSTGNINMIPKKADFIKCNINDTKKVGELISKNKFNAIMHFAGFVKVEESVKNPKKYFNNNTKNSEILFKLCSKHNLNYIIFSSTAAAYGNPSKGIPIKENSILKPLNPYGKSKVMTEKFLLKNKKKFNYIILRYFNVAGADPKKRIGLISKQPTHLIKIASEAAIGKRKNVTIFGTDYQTPDGTAIRDYIHVSDLANIHIEALNFLIKEKKSEIFNCGYGIGYSVKEVLNTANKICGNNIEIKNGKKRKGDSEILVSDISKLNQMIDWQPKYNKLELIIKTAINWEKKLKNAKIL